MSFQNTIFDQNQAIFGGVFYADYNSSIYLQNVTFTNSYALSSGGVLYVNNSDLSSLYSSYLTIN